MTTKDEVTWRETQMRQRGGVKCRSTEVQCILGMGCGAVLSDVVCSLRGHGVFTVAERIVPGNQHHSTCVRTCQTA